MYNILYNDNMMYSGAVDDKFCRLTGRQYTYVRLNNGARYRCVIILFKPCAHSHTHTHTQAYMCFGCQSQVAILYNISIYCMLSFIYVCQIFNRTFFSQT